MIHLIMYILSYSQGFQSFLCYYAMGCEGMCIRTLRFQVYVCCTAQREDSQVMYKQWKVNLSQHESLHDK